MHHRRNSFTSSIEETEKQREAYQNLDVNDAPLSKKRLIIPISILLVLIASFLFLFFFLMGHGNHDDQKITFSSDRDIFAVQLLQHYLKFRTDQPKPEYTGVRNYLVKLAKHLNLEYEVIELEPHIFNVILSWRTKNDTSSIVFLSHSDVVYAEHIGWTFDPFGGELDPTTGHIYGRGAQDMKTIGMEYLAALARLKAETKGPAPYEHSIHLLFAANEESDGPGGVHELLSTNSWSNLNVKFTLDEGLPSGADSDVFRLFYTQRREVHVNITARGNPGHGSSLPRDTATTRMTRILQNALNFRQGQLDHMNANNLTLGEVTSINVNLAMAGKPPTYNVIPSSAMIGLDMRITPGKVSEVTDMVKKWARQENATYVDVTRDATEPPVTPIHNNPWLDTFDSYMKKTNRKYTLEIFPAASDGDHIREYGIPVFGFSPLVRQPTLLHGYNEYINNMTYLEAIQLYEDLMPLLANTRIS